MIRKRLADDPTKKNRSFSNTEVVKELAMEYSTISSESKYSPEIPIKNHVVKIEETHFSIRYKSQLSLRIIYRCFGVFLLLICLCLLPSSADVIILKDGTVLHGKLNRESTSIQDAISGTNVPVLKMASLSYVDDGVRRMVFSSNKNRVGDVQAGINKYGSMERFVKRPIRIANNPIPAKLKLIKDSEFNKNWQRFLKFRDTAGFFVEIRQQLVDITPHYIRIDALTHLNSPYYLTKEFEPERVISYLKNHISLKETDKPDLSKRLRLVRFLIQTGWLKEAEDELKTSQKEIPEEKQKFEEVRLEIENIRLENRIKSVELAYKIGRHQYAKKELQALPKNLPPKLTIRVATLESNYETLFQRYDAAENHLKKLLKDKIDNAVLTEAGQMVLAELHPDTAGRLETFVTLADQAEKIKKKGGKQVYNSEQLLAVAITGWLLGNNASETKVESALRVWSARKLLLAYLRDKGSIGRRGILQEYLKSPEPLGFDELAKLVSQLPPPLADENPPQKPTMVEELDYPGITSKVRYLLHLPPEYQPGRAYPLVVLLPNISETPEDCLKRYGDSFYEAGYIVAVAEWNQGAKFNDIYHYTAEDHLYFQAVLWSLRRGYQVDSDRIFVMGTGEGGTMAMDLGASHPDIFAGVVAISPYFSWTLYKEYWRNYQKLPLYLVSGEVLDQNASDGLRRVLEPWMNKGYPVLAVLYKGRGYDWFTGETEYILDWMSHQKRASAPRDIGRSTDFTPVAGEEFRTMRSTDNYFYWISADQISKDSLLIYNSNRQFFAASIWGKIVEGNLIKLKTRGIVTASVWIGKDMINFEQPIKIEWNNLNITVNNNKPIQPNLEVLLEDLYTRGDRQRPYFDRVILSTIKKKGKGKR